MEHVDAFALVFISLIVASDIRSSAQDSNHTRCPASFKQALRELLETDVKFGEDHSKHYITNVLDIEASDKLSSCRLNASLEHRHASKSDTLWPFLRDILKYFSAKSATFCVEKAQQTRTISNLALGLKQLSFVDIASNVNPLQKLKHGYYPDIIVFDSNASSVLLESVSIESTRTYIWM